jgi:hypothetical protein
MDSNQGADVSSEAEVKGSLLSTSGFVVIKLVRLGFRFQPFLPRVLKHAQLDSYRPTTRPLISE